MCHLFWKQINRFLTLILSILTSGSCKNKKLIARLSTGSLNCIFLLIISLVKVSRVVKSWMGNYICVTG